MKKFVFFFKKYSFLIGPILLLIILSRTDFSKILYSIKKIDPFYLFLIISLSIPLHFIKSVGWNYIKRQQGIKYSLKDSFLMNAVGTYIGALTPGRLGEFTKAIYLKKDGYSMGKSLIGFALDRITDFVFILFFIGISSLFILSVFQKQILILILGILITAIILAVLVRIGLIKWIVHKIIPLFITKKYQKSWKINLQDFINDLKIYKLKECTVIFFITAIYWFFYYFQIYALAIICGINLPFLYLAISITIVGLIVLLPISISGIGTRDATLILLFSPFLVPEEQIIVFSASILLIYLFVALFGFICWLIKPIKIK